MPRKVPDFVLRTAHEGDYYFARDLYIRTMKPLLRELDAWDESAVLSKFDDHYKTDEVQVISLDEIDAGWLQVTETDKELELAQIHLVPAYCSLGIGTHLIRNLMDEAQSKGKSVFLSVVRGNTALSLYQRLGFSVVDADEHRLHMRWNGGRAPK